MFKKHKSEIPFREDIKISFENVKQIVRGYGCSYDEVYNYISPEGMLPDKDLAELYFTRKLHRLYEKNKELFYINGTCFIMSTNVWEILNKPSLWMSYPIVVVYGVEDVILVGSK